MAIYLAKLAADLVNLITVFSILLWSRQSHYPPPPSLAESFSVFFLVYLTSPSYSDLVIFILLLSHIPFLFLASIIGSFFPSFIAISLALSLSLFHSANEPVLLPFFSTFCATPCSSPVSLN